MKNVFLSLSLIIFLVIPNSYAQDSLAFKPSGKIIARGFLDYSTGFGDANDESGFDITRAFLGYNYKFAKNFQGQVIIDGASGKTSESGLEVYVRNAFINWNDGRLNINVGLIGLLQFSTQEDYWMHRYVMKSFQDLNKMAPSVDIGFTMEYQFNKYISADISLTNGEGYKKIKKDDNMRYAAGINLSPIDNLLFRVYADIYNDRGADRDNLSPDLPNIGYDNQYTLSLFAGYQNKLISLGAEYNKVYNKDFTSDKDYYGYSFYTSGKIASKWRAFARFDLMDSNIPSAFTSPWNDLDGNLTMFGVEFRPFKQLKIAPNFRNINPSRNKSEQYLFVNLEFNL